VRTQLFITGNFKVLLPCETLVLSVEQIHCFLIAVPRNHLRSYVSYKYFICIVANIVLATKALKGT
jgi:hypothetical protein